MSNNLPYSQVRQRTSVLKFRQALWVVLELCRFFARWVALGDAYRQSRFFHRTTELRNEEELGAGDCIMKMNFTNAHLTIVVAPIDLRAGFLRLAIIAECLLGIPVTQGGHFVAFIGKHRQIGKVIWCDIKGSCLLTRKLNTGRFEQLLVKVKADNSSVQLTAAEFEGFLDGEPVFEQPQELKF